MAKFFTKQTGAIKVDRENRRLNGVAIITKGDANGEIVDDQTLQLVMQLGNGGGIRARYDHPNRADPREVEQTLDNLLGEHVNFRIDGDTCRADCQFAGVNKEKEDKVMDFGEKTPHLFGTSIVFDEVPPPKGSRPVKGAPCRPARLFAADFVDIPAANVAGLFSAKAEEGKKMDPVDVYAKDGKCFAMVDGKEIELKHTAEALKALMPADSAEGGDDEDDEKDGAKKKGARLNAAAEPIDVDAAKAEAAAEAVKAERAYHKQFAAARTTSGLTGKDADEFDAKFYGLEIEQVKFLASNTIAARSKPLGEGSGNPEPQKEEEKDKAEVRKYCATRFANDSTMRRRFKCNTTVKEDPTYGAALERYIAVETKCRADEAAPQQRKASGTEKDSDDFIGNMSKSVFVEV